MDSNEIASLMLALNKQICFKFRNINGIRDLSQDFVQEGILRFLKYGRRELTVENTGYIYKICRNVAIAYLKKNGQLSTVTLSDENYISESFETQLIENDVLSNVLKNLEPRERTVIWLRYAKELSFKEIGSITATNLNTVLSIHHRAIKRLRKNLGYYEGNHWENKIPLKESLNMKKDMSMIYTDLLLLKERCFNLAVQLAFRASVTGEGEGYSLAVVADELRNLSYKLRDAVYEKDEVKLNDICSQCQLLALNACVLGLRFFNNSNLFLPQDRYVSIIAEEIRIMAVELKVLLQNDNSKFADYSFDVPVVASPNKVSVNKYGFLSFVIGGEYFAENVQLVKEILYYPGVINNLKDGFLDFRNMHIPFFDIYQKLGIEKPASISEMCAIIFTKADNRKACFAVPVDGVNVNGVFESKLGTNSAKPVSKFGAGILRESWDTNLNKQINFLDWEGLMK